MLVLEVHFTMRLRYTLKIDILVCLLGGQSENGGQTQNNSDNSPRRILLVNAKNGIEQENPGT